MKQLRDRVFKLREDYDHIYHLSRSEGKPSINWGNMMDEKLVGVILTGKKILTQSEIKDCTAHVCFL